jgi:hypothetical protein
MEGGLAIILALVLFAVIGAAFFLFLGGRSAVRRGHEARQDEPASRPRHEAPHPEQAERERGTLYPGS